MTKRFYIGFLTFLTALNITAAAGESEILSSIIDKYLANKISAAEEEALDATGKIAEITKNNNSPSAQIADYLSGNMSVSPELILMATEKKPAEAALVYMALFVRKTAVDIRLNKDEMTFYLDNYIKAQSSANSPAVKKWAAQAQEWKKWCAASFQLSKGMPPLLATKAQDTLPANIAASLKDLTELNAANLSSSREIFKNRPRPQSLNFPKTVLQKYIDALPSRQLKSDEARRIGVVTKLKPYLITLLGKTPYYGMIKLKKVKFQGVISMANDNVIVTTEKGRDKSKAYKWDEVPVEQLIDIIEYFAQLRVKGSGALVSAKERATHAAQDYLQLAFFLDWYGNYPEAVKYIKKAVELSPEVSKDALFLIKGSASEPKK